jgi:hypothetical protein
MIATGSNIVVTHRIAGVTFRTESDSWLPRFQDEPFNRFLVSNDQVPDVYHRIHRIAPGSLTLPSPAEEEWNRFPPNLRRLLREMRSPLLYSPLVRSRLVATLPRTEDVTASLTREQFIIRDFARRELDVFYTPELGEHPAEVHVAANFRLLFSTFFPCFSAVLVHCASVVRAGRAAVFLAPDEGGKTTISVDLSDGGAILHDDQVVFRKEGSTVYAYATPLGRNTGGPRRAPIGGLFLLEKALHFELIPLQASDLVQLLWAAHTPYTGSLSKDTRKHAFAVFCDACYQAPAYRLRFSRDYVDWDTIDTAMTE